MGLRDTWNNFYDKTRSYGIRLMPQLQKAWNNLGSGLRTVQVYSDTGRNVLKSIDDTIQKSGVSPKLKGHISNVSQFAGQKNLQLQNASNKLLELQKRLGVHIP